MNDEDDIELPPRRQQTLDVFRDRGKVPKTYVEEIALKYIKRLKWTNETLDADTRLFWMTCHRLWKQRPTMFRDLLEWAADNHLHPKQFVKAVNTKLSTKASSERKEV